MTSGTSSARRHAVADALHSAAIHVLRRVRKADEHTGIGPARLSALSVLVFAGAMRLTDLARAEQVRPPTMTKIVMGLKKEGFVRQRSDPGDARAVRLEATARGTRLLQAARRRRVARITRALQDLDRTEVDVLARASAIMKGLSC